MCRRLRQQQQTSHRTAIRRIGTWSDEDIKRALITGLRPEHARLPGAPLAAIMPANFYKALTAEDLDAVVAYLRSIPAVKKEVPPPVYKMPVMRGNYTDAEKQYTLNSLTDQVTRGRYIHSVGRVPCRSAGHRQEEPRN